MLKNTAVNSNNEPLIENCTDSIVLLYFNHLYLSEHTEKKGYWLPDGVNMCVAEKGHHLKMLKYSRESVYVYINIFRQAAAGGVRSKTLVCIVCVSAPLAPCRVITWGNLLPNQHWHTQRQSTPPPPPPPFFPSPQGPASWSYTISFSSFTEMANGWLLFLNTFNSYFLAL